MFEKLKSKFGDAIENAKNYVDQKPTPMVTETPTVAVSPQPPAKPAEPIHTPDGDLPPVPEGIKPTTEEPHPEVTETSEPTPTIEREPLPNAPHPPLSPEARMASAVQEAREAMKRAAGMSSSTTPPPSPATPPPVAPITMKPVAPAPIQASAPAEDDIVRGNTLHEVKFADIWYTPENVAYVRDVKTRFALTPIQTKDLEDFHRVLEQSYQGISSYAVKFGGDAYRVERVNTADGLQYNCRKMPTECPEIETLGFAPGVVKHLTSLSRAAGLLLFAGPTGQGKTTTVSALMKRYLDTDGGFLYTIEDPPEMPLGGVYHAKNGGLGLCKQTPVENDQWGAGLRSALRSKPRYILVGEIRTPETASQCLVAATSGHLVLSTIHASGVEDALNSMIKYASSTGLDSSLVSDLLARGILGVVHQRLEGTTQLKLIYQYAFANPNPNSADQMRMTIRDGNINLATFMEQQHTKMDRGLPLFKD